MTLEESIAKNLKGMPNAKLVQVARYVHEIMPEVVEKQHAALSALCGSLSEEAGQSLEDALTESDQMSVLNGLKD